MIFLVSSEFFVRPKGSNAIVDATGEFVNAAVLHEKVVDHAAMGDAVDAALQARRLARQEFQMLEEMKSESIELVLQMGEAKVTPNDASWRRVVAKQRRRIGILSF